MTAGTADPYVVQAEGGAWHWQAGAGRWDWVAAAPPRQNVQHVGMRDNAGIAAINERNVAQQAAVAKAQSDPAAMAYEEVLRLPDAELAKLLREGKLAHLGMGARRTRGRQS